MKFLFKPNEYCDVIDILDKKYDSIYGVLDQYKIDENEDTELYAYGLSIDVPELNITVRPGAEYDKNEEIEDSPTPSFVIYPYHEKEPTEYRCSFCGAEFEQLIESIRKEQENKKGSVPECIIDEDDFDLFDVGG